MMDMAKTDITEEMSDAAFRSLAAGVIKAEGRALPRPLPKQAERKPLKEREAKPETDPYEGTIARQLIEARIAAKASAMKVRDLQAEMSRLQSSGAKKRELRASHFALKREEKEVVRLQGLIRKLTPIAREIASVGRSTIGMEMKAAGCDAKWKAARERKLKKLERPERSVRNVNVESPFGPLFDGKTGNRINDDRVTRIVDTIDLLLKQRQIDRDQEAAARMVQDAWASAPGNIRCALAAGEGGAGPGSRSPSERQLWAGGVLNDVRRELGQIDSLVVIRICGLGMTVADAAAMEFSGRLVNKREKLHIGMRLRMALALLAKVWGLRTHMPKVGEGSADLRSAKARNDEFVLRSFDTKHVGSTSSPIGALSGGNASDIEARRDRERELTKREERRARCQPKKKSGAQAA